MSGFSPDWLALREPADHAARDGGLAAALAARFAGRDAARIVDLGCGAGSNLRALMPYLPGRQHWTLVDWDPALLAAARERLAAWSDAATAEGEALRIEKDGRVATVTFRQADLTRDLPACLEPTPDLVTAAALFDLVSAGWIATFAGELSARRVPLYTVLTYDGTERWSPPHPLDEAVLAAFHAHQGGDKGFGPAAGPKAGAALEHAFAAAGYTVDTAASPWRLGDESRALVGELAAGIAAAAVEAGGVSAADGAAWALARRAASAVVGHVDILAWPRR